jgi:hypothetical protein
LVVGLLWEQLGFLWVGLNQILEELNVILHAFALLKFETHELQHVHFHFWVFDGISEGLEHLLYSLFNTGGDVA